MGKKEWITNRDPIFKSGGVGLTRAAGFFCAQPCGIRRSLTQERKRVVGAASCEMEQRRHDDQNSSLSIHS
jgi:hypothetical protein